MILVVIEQLRGTLNRMSLEALAAAAAIGKELNHPVEALIAGHKGVMVGKRTATHQSINNGVMVGRASLTHPTRLPGQRLGLMLGPH